MATPSETAEASTCFSCLSDQIAALLWQLDEIRINGGGSEMTVAEVAEASACWSCISDQPAAILYLANQVVENGGGGGSNNISGAGSPVGVVTPDALNQFYRDTTGTGLWQSTGLTNTEWVNWI